MSAEPSHDSVLIVDDDDVVRNVLKRVLTRGGHASSEAATAAEARACMQQDDAPDVVLLDIGLPDSSGLDLASEVVDGFPDIAVIVVSGSDDPDLACSALDSGVYGWIPKPFSASAILTAVHTARHRRDLRRVGREQRVALEALVLERTRDLHVANEATIQLLSKAIEYRDLETREHVMRMSRFTGALSRRFGLDEAAMRTASSMHDVGKIGVPDSILLKPGPLDPDERLVMENHTVIGHDLLSGSGIALLDLAASIALSHHERWDGRGYPNRLSGEDIPLAGRIAACADVFDALTSPRRYRPRVYTSAEALDYITSERGTQFDPAVVDALVDATAVFSVIRRALPDWP
jgi:putative two-component system response regulator